MIHTERVTALKRVILRVCLHITSLLSLRPVVKWNLGNKLPKNACDV